MRQTCEPRFSVLVYIWKIISTYMALTFLFFSILKNLPKKKNQQQHSIRYFRRALGIHMIYRLTNLIALQQFLCQSNVWRAPRYFFLIEEHLSMFVMEGEDPSLHLPPSKHRINCDPTVGEKKICITVVVKNADKQLNEECTTVLFYPRYFYTFGIVQSKKTSLKLIIS